MMVWIHYSTSLLGKQVVVDTRPQSWYSLALTLLGKGE